LIRKRKIAKLREVKKKRGETLVNFGYESKYDSIELRNFEIKNSKS
jgi:hypothetical protein